MPQPAHSTNSASAAQPAPPEVFGSVTPRIWTPPLRELTPETSYGFDVIDFARDVLGIELDEWQKWLAIHIGELLPDNRPRFRIALAVVSRQCGKTLLAKALILYWMFIEQVPLILTTSTDRSYAKKTWTDINTMIESNPMLKPELDRIRLTIGEEATFTTAGSELMFAANNARAGRSRTVRKALIDEVREHKNLDAWSSIKGAMQAERYAQAVCITNEGEDGAVLLDNLRDSALAYLETGEGDPRLGIFEWSVPPGAEPDDLAALAQSVPALGYRIDPGDVLADARRAMRLGGTELMKFTTEIMCRRVGLLDPAIDPSAWELCAGDVPSFAGATERVAMALDVSLDERHATLVAAVDIDGVTHVQVVAHWDGLDDVRRELAPLIRKHRPRRFGTLPAGPAAALSGDLTATRQWPPRGTELAPITTDKAAICMAMPGLVASGKIRHNGDPLLAANVERGQRQRTGDVWVFGRKGVGPVDALYAMAAAVHLARTMPPPRPALVAL